MEATVGGSRLLAAAFIATTTVSGSSTVTLSIQLRIWRSVGWPFVRNVSSEKATSSAVSGAPSWKRASGRRWKAKTFSSSETDTDSATSP